MSALFRGGLCIAAAWTLLSLTARADIVVRTNGGIADGKIVRQDDSQVRFQPEGQDQILELRRSTVSRAILTDEHGGELWNGSTTRPVKSWSVPPEPAAPPIVPAPAGKPTYCLIPLHGEVGSTILASALEKSLQDAALRKPTVVVLDIDSPGGLVAEARKITQVLHRYNKRMRIVALADQDLSAAAILTLSVREIYLKSTGTIGAATSYVPNQLNLPPKIEEKMQSAWRAVARNSAEEGHHEPLLAEAMIDNDVELHVDTVNGKPVVSEGPGEHVLCRKGRILTLTSHEAVDCGLAAGEADDLNELGAMLHLDGWTECKGLGTLLAAYLPSRAEDFKAESERTLAEFQQNLRQAISTQPSAELSSMMVTVRPIGPRRFGPGVRYAPGTVVTRVSHAHWKVMSLRCVVALLAVEQNLADAAALCTAYGQDGQAETVQTALTEFAAARARIYDNRNQYGSPPGFDAAAPTRLAANTPDAGSRAGTIRSELFGGDGGHPFSIISRDGRPVVGFRWRTGTWRGRPILRQLAPIYVRPAAGLPIPVNTMYSRPGYAAVGLSIASDDNGVAAVRVLFARVKDEHIAADDTYQSDWIGEPGDAPVHELHPADRVVIGIHGRHGLNIDALGAIFAPPSPSSDGGENANDPAERPEAPANNAPPQAGSTTSTRSELFGGDGGDPFSSVSPDGRPIVGFRWRTGDWAGRSILRQIDPVFERPEPGLPLPANLVLARDGYVAIGITIDSNETGVWAMRFLFGRVENGRVITSSVYKSDWIGRPGNDEVHELRMPDHILIGIHGRRGMNLDALGAVFGPAK